MAKEKIENNEVKEKLPNLVSLILISTLVAAMGGSIWKINITGFGWLVPLVFSLYLIIQNRGKITFPIWVWSPWILIIIFNLTRLYYVNSFQREVMLLCPAIVGIAVSTIGVSKNQAEVYIKALRKYCIALFIIILYKANFITQLELPDATPLAAEVMIGMIFISIFVTTYFHGEKKDLYYILGLLFLPFLAIMRMAMMVTAISIPLNFSKISIIKRSLLFFAIILGGIFVLNTARVQKKMFFQTKQFQKRDMFDLIAEKGFSVITDISDDPRLNTTGRSFMWEAVTKDAAKDPILGKGIGSCEVYVRKITYGSAGYPHNDWLLTYYDFGLVGVFALGLSILLAMGHCIYSARRSTGYNRMLFLAMAYSFIPYALMMITDNIMVYASFFGNFQFCTMGLAYAIINKEKQ